MRLCWTRKPPPPAQQCALISTSVIANITANTAPCNPTSEIFRLCKGCVCTKSKCESVNSVHVIVGMVDPVSGTDLKATLTSGTIMLFMTILFPAMPFLDEEFVLHSLDMKMKTSPNFRLSTPKSDILLLAGPVNNNSDKSIVQWQLLALHLVRSTLTLLDPDAFSLILVLAEFATRRIATCILQHIIRPGSVR